MKKSVEILPDVIVKTRKNLTGCVFGKLTVLKRANDRIDKNGKRVAYWKTRCLCGNEKDVRGYSLISGVTRSCGCLSKEQTACLLHLSKERSNSEKDKTARVRVKTDLTGLRFGRWTVIERADDRVEPSGKKVPYWTCLCECGSRKDVPQGNLKKGRSTSCGCYHRELTKELFSENHQIKHGGSVRGKRERLYNIWTDMKKRCFNSSHVAYKWYGGKGVSVCTEWEHDYASFRRWALSSGFDPDADPRSCTIDRIDVSGDYSPTNCRWVCMSEQARNKSNTVRYAFEGKSLCLSEWAVEKSIPLSTLVDRIYKRHLTIEEALKLPICKMKSVKKKGV